MKLKPFSIINMTYQEQKEMYEKIMHDVAEVVKKRLNESDSVYTEVEGLKMVLSADRVAEKFKGESVGAFDPSIKGDPKAKDWNMYAVKITDIKDAKCSYYGRNDGWPSYMTSHMTLLGKVSYIKAGNGQLWEPSFPGKLEIMYNPQNNFLFFEPYKFEGKYEDMSFYNNRDTFYHFANRGVRVKQNDIEREVSAKKELKDLIDDLTRGYRSDNVIQYLIKEKYMKIEDGHLVPVKKDDK